MKVILTVGSPQSGYEAVAHLLSQAGIAQANASNKANLTPQALQEQLLHSHEIDLSSATALAQVQPGKFWNELAADLFLSNIQKANWGWADHQTALLMDFWHDFDAQVRLLLIYNSPAKHLEQVLSRNTKPTAQTITAALDDWVRWNTVLLRYLHRHPDYCVLVNSQQAIDQPQALVERLSAHWQLSSSNVPAASPSQKTAHHHLQAHLISQFIDKHHPALALHQELEGASFLQTNASSDPVESHMGNPYGAWADWVKASAQLTALGEMNIALTHASEKASELNTGFQQENEHLLLQFHEVQQELEICFLKNETLTQLVEQAEHITGDLIVAQTQRDELAQENASLSAAREIAIQDKTDALAQLETLVKENVALTQSSEKASEKNTWLRQESEQLLLQLHEVQQELEQYYLLYQQVKNESDLKTKTAGFSADFWLRNQPQELVIDLQQEIAGSNWYPPESDGRWAGPATLSTLQMPAMQTGNYLLELDIVDAMHPDIVNGLVIEAFNQTHPVEVSYPLYKNEYPLVCKVPISISANMAAEPWLIGLRFPQLVSPGDSGSDDKRHLSIRLRTLRLVKQS